MLNHFHSFASVAAVVALAATVAPAQAEGTVMFNYQGRVKVQGNEFNGDGQFKFAIVSPIGEATLWSSDGTSVDGSEPTTGITLPVTDGVFNVVMGANGVMQPINSTVFQSKVPLKLRTWFNDGTNGFQQLHPDHNLINTSLITSETSDEDFVIYVDGQNGNDNNSGLKPNQAKKTIQGAVDILPARVMANVTIDIADGTYAEEVLLYGLNVRPGKSVTLKGDDTWTPSSSGIPSVVVTGADGSTTGVRSSALSAVNCNNIELTGITFRDGGTWGLSLENGSYVIRNCYVTNNGVNGISIANQATGKVYGSVSTGNRFHGMGAFTNSRVLFSDCKSFANDHTGLVAMDNSTVNLDRSGDYSNNAVHGVYCISNSSIGASNEAVLTIRNNKYYGIVAGWESYYANVKPRSTITGNLKGSELSFAGSNMDW